MEVAPFFSIFTIFCRFSPFFIDFHDLRTFVAIYILSRFTQFFWAKIAFSVTSHVFCMYVVVISRAEIAGTARPHTELVWGKPPAHSSLHKMFIPESPLQGVLNLCENLRTDNQSFSGQTTSKINYNPIVCTIVITSSAKYDLYNLVVIPV